MTAAKDATTPVTILLVDDEQAVRAIVVKILRRAKYDVIEAENGEAALRLAQAHPGKIDVVITDMYMPGLRGPEVVQALAPDAARLACVVHVRLRGSGRENRCALGRELSEQAFLGAGADGGGGSGAQRPGSDLSRDHDLVG